MVLVAANTAGASVCEAYCAGTGKSNTGHHHQKEPQSFASSHPAHAHGASINCPECLKSLGQLLEQPDCRSFAQLQTLQGSARPSSINRGDSQLDVNQTPVDYLVRPVENARFSPLHPPPQMSGFAPLLVSLRI
jgi:hypothetical protein